MLTHWSFHVLASVGNAHVRCKHDSCLLTMCTWRVLFIAYPSKPVCPAWWETHRQSLWAREDFGDHSGQSLSGIAIILKVL